MICHIDRLPLKRERQLQLCCFLFSLFAANQLARKKISLWLNRPKRKMIAIALTEHLGDIVAAEPLLRQLRHKFPNDFFVWIVAEPYREIVENHPDVNMTVALHCLTEWIFLKRFRLFDHIYDLHIPNRRCTTCDKTLIKRSGNLKINPENYYFFGNLLSVMAQNSGLSVIADVPILHIPKSIADKVNGIPLPHRYVCIHCGSNEAARSWGAANWRNLARFLSDQHQINVVEVGLETVIEDATNPHFITLCGRLSILETAEVIRRADLFIGTDSGPAHLANAVGTFGIILLGHYREFAHYMPYSGDYQHGTNAEILFQDGPVSDTPPESVLKVLRKHFGNDLQQLKTGTPNNSGS